LGAYARKQVECGDDDLSIDELLMQWLDSRGCTEINAVIRHGLDEIDAGQVVRFAKSWTSFVKSTIHCQTHRRGGGKTPVWSSSDTVSMPRMPIIDK
jgi:hypothetical protein